MRKNAKVDANQPEIVKVLRGEGCFVVHTHELGKGVPDLWITKGLGRSCWIEIKDGSKPKSSQKLTEAEALWRSKNPDPGHVINSIEAAQELARAL